jgi:Flp pilus assembly protein TadG
MMLFAGTLLRDRTGAAAAELALVTPLLIVVMTCTFELGYYFLSEHVVQKAVRDAARYAGRLPASTYDCSTSTVSSGAQTQIQKVARTGTPDGTIGRLGGWTADSMTTVGLACQTSTAISYVNKGLYAEFPSGHVPVVTVTATVPHPTLFGTMTIASSSSSECGAGQNASWRCLRLYAKSQSAVFGA